MERLGDLLQSADWKSEKHVPTIQAPDTVKAGEAFAVKAMVGEEIAHPNTTEHHIRWIHLYFKPDDGKFPFEIGIFFFNAHGESPAGANSGPVYTDPAVTAMVKISVPGVLYAESYCNIHGLWDYSKKINVE